MSKDYKINDVVWYKPISYLLIVKTKIVEIDDFFRKKHPQAYLFYWIDEPVGHGLTDELSETKEEAIQALKKHYNILLEDNNEYRSLGEEEIEIDSNPQLNIFRKNNISFIVSTWETCDTKQEEKDRWYKELENKIYGVDWFNIENI